MFRQETLMQLLTGKSNRPITDSATDVAPAELAPLPLEWQQAKASQKQGSFELAYNQLHSVRENTVLAEHSQLLQQDIYRCIEGIANLFLVESIPALREDIIAYRKTDAADDASIANLCRRLIHFKYYGDDEVYSLHELAADEFLLDCLANDFYPDTHIETFLTDIRRQLLLGAVKNMELDETYLPLVQAIAIQGYLTNYVFYNGDDEAAVVGGLNEDLGNLLTGTECELDDITNLLLLLAMYRPLFETNAYPALEGVLVKQLPDVLQTIFALTYQEPADLKNKASQVISLGEINEQSRTIRQQYEESPYPRYSRLSFWTEPQPYRHRSLNLLDDRFDLDVLDSKPLEVLVAGSGTGNQPLRLARSIRNINITAIDLSRNSLAFAERMRAAYGIGNVEFYQADILELPKVFNAKQQRFHVIECVGVLHHLEDPEAGLAALNELLVPGGVIHLALYSKRARSRVLELRDLINKLGMKPHPDHIRQFRKQLFTSDLDETLQQILYARDFYNLNGCRDLLFNSQETSLTVPQISCLLESQNLEFLGFQFADNNVEKRFLEMFPAGDALLNLEYWHQYEQMHPDTFWHMYQFFCRKPS